MSTERLNPEIPVRHISPNTSARSTGISLIVLHSTESSNLPGSADLQGVADWFANPTSQVSAHVITDDDGHSARCVADRDKAWACVEFNSPSLNIEQIGRAAQSHWSRREWLETARWIAQWSHEHHIPIRRAEVAGAYVIRSGVTTHAALGAAGGGHHDPGPDYPLEEVLHEARRIKRLRYG
jgi:N-acetyl-anhydromuramyl-L-alanine amidase AmpD